MTMPGYTKLFSSMIHSTIWREPNHVRIVWVTMLAMADREGNVEASTPGLADVARVTVDECKEALGRLMAPDSESRSKELDGRRIVAIDGGWHIVNHAKYREKLSKEDQREKTAARVARYRERQRNATALHVTTVTESNDSNYIAEAEAEAEANRERARTRPIDTGSRRFAESFDSEAPDSLVFSEDHRAIAQGAGLDLTECWLECRDNRRAKRYRCGNWEAEFAAWLRREAKFMRNSRKAQSKPEDDDPNGGYDVVNPCPTPARNRRSGATSDPSSYPSTPKTS